MWGNSRFTAVATSASSPFSTRTISSADLVSNPRVRGFCCSVFAGFTRPQSSFYYTGRGYWVCELCVIVRSFVPRKLSRRRYRFCQPERLDNRIVQSRAHLADLFVGARGVHAIGQQDHEKVALRVNPQRGAGKPGVTKAACRKILARRGGRRGRHVPSQGSRRVTYALSSGKFLNRCAGNDAVVLINSAIQEHLRKNRHITGRRK